MKYMKRQRDCKKEHAITKRGMKSTPSKRVAENGGGLKALGPVGAADQPQRPRDGVLRGHSRLRKIVRGGGHGDRGGGGEGDRKGRGV